MDTSFYLSLNAEEKWYCDRYKANSPYVGQQFFADYLNDLLRRGQSLDGLWDHAARCLDRVVSKGRSAQDATLYRATFDDFVSPHIQENIFHTPAFLSTSKMPDNIERHWSNAIGGRTPARLTIHCPTGTPMAPMEGNPSFGGHETEVLLGRGARLRVISCVEIVDRETILSVMSPYYGKDYRKLIEYELEFLEHPQRIDHDRDPDGAARMVP